MSKSPLSQITILDGGLGHLLKDRGVVEQPCCCFDDEKSVKEVRRAHDEYCTAGVDVITTNTFSCTRWSLERIGRSGDEALQLAVKGAKLAQEVAAATSRNIAVAGTTVNSSMNRIYFAHPKTPTIF